MACEDVIGAGKNSFDGSFWDLNVAGTLTASHFTPPPATGSFVVSQIPGQGNYDTVTAALVAAQAAIVADPGLTVNIIVYPGTYIEDINLVAGANILAQDQAPAVVGSSYVPPTIIQGQVTDVGVPDEAYVSLVGLTFQDNNQPAVFNLLHAWCVMQNCVVQTAQLALSSAAFVLAGFAFVQFQNSSVTANFSLPDPAALVASGNAGMYYYLSNAYGAHQLTGSSYVLGNYTSFAANQAILEMNGTAFFESQFCTLEAGTADFRVAAAGSVVSTNDLFSSVGPAVVGVGAGVGTVVSITNPTFFEGGTGIDATVVNAPQPVGTANYMTPLIATATAGAVGAPPATVSGYLPVQLGGVSYRIPLYLP
jgi:hypothetical protein